LQPDTPPNHDDQLITGLRQQFGHRPRRRRAYLAGEPTSTARITIPDELVPTASAARCEALVYEPDQQAHDTGLNPANSPAEVKAHRLKRVGHGFRNFSNYRLRLLLHCGVTWQTHRTARLRGSSPCLVA
jgi:hypothetical protein